MNGMKFLNVAIVKWMLQATASVIIPSRTNLNQPKNTFTQCYGTKGKQFFCHQNTNPANSAKNQNETRQWQEITTTTTTAHKHPRAHTYQEGDRMPNTKHSMYLCTYISENDSCFVCNFGAEYKWPQNTQNFQHQAHAHRNRHMSQHTIPYHTTPFQTIHNSHE